MDLSALEQTWPVARPWRLTPLTGGTNNRVWRVETPAGGYALRVASNIADPERLRFELDILTQLAAQGLPFAVPAPIPTATGELYARVATGEQGNDGEGLATLMPLIPGEPPAREHLGQARAAGEALGMLDEALARIPAPDAGAGVNWRSFGDLAHTHPLVPDPLAAIRELPIAEEMRERLAAGYSALLARIPALYAQLPQQLIHEDYDPTNILMAGERVTGVLDFEFCARDVRVMDPVVALTWWPVRVFGTGEEWPVLRAFAEGYARRVSLARAELEAAPTLFQLRAYTSLLHRLGRQRQGLSAMEEVTARARAAIERDDWLAANGARLVETLAAAS